MSIGERKFSEELEIKLDESQNNIENIESIIENIKKLDDETELKNCTEYYFRMIENYDMINREQLTQILEALKKKKENIIEESVNEETKEKIDRIKKDNNKLQNFNIINTLKEDNDKIDGLKRDVIYLEFNDNGNKLLYEIENKEMINKILSDFDLIQNKNEYEIMNLLNGYLKKCDIINMETKTTELPTDNYNKEINQIIDGKKQEVFNNNENAILKEKVDFKIFVDKYKKGQNISYAINSSGERIYMIDNEKYKYVGNDRELKKLTDDGKDDNDMNISKFNSEMKGRGNLPEINLEEFTHIRNYIGYEQLLIYIMAAMENNIGISEKQNDFLARFIGFGMEHKALNIPIPGESLNYLYERFMMTFGEEKLKVMFSKMHSYEEKELDKHKELKLEPPKNNKLSNWEKAGFISVAIVLEGTLLLVGIFSILALVK